MTDKQLKMMAELILVSDARITALTELLNQWIEISLHQFPPGSKASKRALALLSSFEQQEALAKVAEKERKEARKFFGLEP
jgi:hypothetical protein